MGLNLMSHRSLPFTNSTYMHISSGTYNAYHTITERTNLGPDSGAHRAIRQVSEIEGQCADAVTIHVVVECQAALAAGAWGLQVDGLTTGCLGGLHVHIISWK